MDCPINDRFRHHAGAGVSRFYEAAALRLHSGCIPAAFRLYLSALRLRSGSNRLRPVRSSPALGVGNMGVRSKSAPPVRISLNV